MKKIFLFFFLIATIIPSYTITLNPFRLVTRGYSLLPALIKYPIRKSTAFLGRCCVFLANHFLPVKATYVDTKGNDLVEEDNEKNKILMKELEEAHKKVHNLWKMVNQLYNKLQEHENGLNASTQKVKEISKSNDNQIAQLETVADQDHKEITDFQEQSTSSFSILQESIKEGSQQIETFKNQFFKLSDSVDDHRQITNEHFTKTYASLENVKQAGSKNHEELQSCLSNLDDSVTNRERDRKVLEACYTRLISMEETAIETEKVFQKQTLLFQKKYQQQKEENNKLTNVVIKIAQKINIDELNLRRMAAKSPFALGLLTNLESIGLIQNIPLPMPKQFLLNKDE